MKLTKREIEIRICLMASQAMFNDQFNDNVEVLKCLFMIEFYKDLLNESTR